MDRPLSAAIIARRNELGISQARLAALTELAPGQISKLEAGDREDPRWSTMVKLSRALKLSLDELADSAVSGRLTESAGDLSLASLDARLTEIEHFIERVGPIPEGISYHLWPAYHAHSR